MQTAKSYSATTPQRKGVVFQKPDLDTCLTALILNVTDKDRLIALPLSDTPSHLLSDPAVLCIEAGGSGQTELNNFDHHDSERSFPPACQQAYQICGNAHQTLARLVAYVAKVDDGIPPCPSPLPGEVYLSHLFSGLLLLTPSIEDRFLDGIAFLQTVLRLGLDPFADIPVHLQWRQYLDAWHDNKSQLALSAHGKEMFRTSTGQLAGFLQHPAIGGFDLLYAAGCDIAILANSTWGPERIRKYTIGSRCLPLNDLLASLNRQDNGWGGRTHIIGSPRPGSTLAPDTIKEIVARSF